MREILFRGKTYNGEWVEGNFIDWGNHVQVYICPLLNYATSYDLGTSIRMHAKAVIPETVGQYTGLTDKNGKKIFEGDIISSDWGYKGIVEFDEIMYAKLECLFNEECEIIGNIHDNPELMESEDTE